MAEPKRTVLTVGECMVELSPGEADTYRMGFAGDAFNAAWYLRRSLPGDWRVGFVTAVGDDALSNRMVDFFAAEGVDTNFVRRVRGGTPGLYMIQLEEGERSFSYWRGQSAARALADDADWLEGAFQHAKMVLVSGITLAILSSEARERLRAALEGAREAGVEVAFDTNLRARLWSGAKEMRETVSAFAECADILLPSFDEEHEVFGDATPDETISRYKSAGASLIVVKNGTEPLTVWSQESGTQSFQPIPAHAVADTTAAGDSFAAGFLGEYLLGGSVADAAEVGMALSARVVQGKGALVRDATTDP